MSNKKSIRGLTDLVPYVVPYLIFLGVVRLIIYYETFGINIVSFLDFTEILTSFFDILMAVIVFGSFTILPTLLFYGKQEYLRNENELKAIHTEPKFGQRLLKYLSYFGPSLGSTLAQLLCLYIISYFHPIPKGSLLYFSLFFLALTAFRIFLIELAIKQKGVPEWDKRFSDVVVFVVLSVGILFYLTYGEIEAVKNNGKFTGTRIELNDGSTLFSNDNYYFIGKTNNYVFVYSEIKKETEVIPIDRVKSLTFRTKDH